MLRDLRHTIQFGFDTRDELPVEKFDFNSGTRNLSRTNRLWSGNVKKKTFPFVSYVNNIQLYAY